MRRYVICRLNSDNKEEYYRVSAQSWSINVWDDAIWFSKPDLGIAQAIDEGAYIRRLTLVLGSIVE